MVRLYGAEREQKSPHTEKEEDKTRKKKHPIVHYTLIVKYTQHAAHKYFSIIFFGEKTIARRKLYLGYVSTTISSFRLRCCCLNLFFFVVFTRIHFTATFWRTSHSRVCMWPCALCVYIHRTYWIRIKIIGC